MPGRNYISRRTALKSLGTAATAPIGVGLTSAKSSPTQHQIDIDDINEEVQKEWQSVIKRHGKIIDSEHAALGKTDTIFSTKELASIAESARTRGQIMALQRIRFEDGYTADVTTALDRTAHTDGGTFRKAVDGIQFKTNLSQRDVRTLNQKQQEATVGENTTKDTEFAATANPVTHDTTTLADKTDFSVRSGNYDYEATSAEDSNSAQSCPGPCWLWGLNWATDTDEADNRCGVSAVDAVVSINADAYAEVFTTAYNNVKTGYFDITFDGYTKGTVSSLGMAAGTDFLGFVKNLDTGESEAINIGTLNSNWADVVDTIDAQWGPGDGAGPGDDAPYTDYEFTTELTEGDTYAFGIRMNVSLANISLPGSITINFTDTSNPLDDGFGMSYDVIGADW